MAKYGIRHNWGWIQLELTDICNLKCVMCPQSEGKNYQVHNIFREDSSEILENFTLESDAELVYMILSPEFRFHEGFREDLLTREPMKFDGKVWYTNILLRPGVYHYWFVEKKGDVEKRIPDPVKIEGEGGNQFSVRNVGNVKGRIHGFMKFELFKKIIDSAAELGEEWNEISPFWYGESLLHPQFPKFMRYLAEKNTQHHIFRILGLHTNGILLEGENAEALLDSLEAFPGISKILFSLDAATEGTYSNIRRGGDFKRVLKNIDHFVNEIKRKEMNNVRLAFQFIVQEENKDEAGDFLSYWSRYLDEKKIPFRVSSDWGWGNFEDNHFAIFFRALDGSDEEREKNNQLHREVVSQLIPQAKPKNGGASKPVYPHPCSSLFRSPFIQWNGEVSVCCADSAMTIKAGDFNKQSLKEIWHGRTITDMRLAHILGDSSHFTMRCRSCSQWLVPSLSQDEVIEYLTAINAQDALKQYLQKVSEYK